jgi:hypothetical protein
MLGGTLPAHIRGSLPRARQVPLAGALVECGAPEFCLARRLQSIRVWVEILGSFMISTA